MTSSARSGLLGDLGVQADERVTQFRLDQHVAWRAPEFERRHVDPVAGMEWLASFGSSRADLLRPFRVEGVQH